MCIVYYFEVVCSTYHDTPVMQLRFLNEAGPEPKLETSNLYTPSEITNLISLWRQGELLGSFGLGTKLDPAAGFTMCEK